MFSLQPLILVLFLKLSFLLNPCHKHFLRNGKIRIVPKVSILARERIIHVYIKYDQLLKIL